MEAVELAPAATQPFDLHPPATEEEEEDDQQEVTDELPEPAADEPEAVQADISAAAAPAAPVTRTFFLVRIPKPEIDNALSAITRMEERRDHLREKQKFCQVALTMKQERLKKSREEIRAKQDTMAPLQASLKRGAEETRNVRTKSREMLCSSEAELDALLQEHEYRIQHESIPLTEEKKLVRQIKQLKDSREAVRQLDAQKHSLSGTKAERDELHSQLKFWREEIEVLRSQHAVHQQVLDKHREEAAAIDAQIEGIRNEKAQIQLQHDELMEELRVAKKNLYNQEKEHRNNRRDIRTARGMAEAKQYDECEALCAEQRERMHALLNGDVEYRKHYVKLSQKRNPRRAVAVGIYDPGLDDILDETPAKPAAAAPAANQAEKTIKKPAPPPKTEEPIVEAPLKPAVKKAEVVKEKLPTSPTANGIVAEKSSLGSDGPKAPAKAEVPKASKVSKLERIQAEAQEVLNLAPKSEDEQVDEAVEKEKRRFAALEAARAAEDRKKRSEERRIAKEQARLERQNEEEKQRKARDLDKKLRKKAAKASSGAVSALSDATASDSALTSDSGLPVSNYNGTASESDGPQVAASKPRKRAPSNLVKGSTSKAVKIARPSKKAASLVPTWLWAAGGLLFIFIGILSYFLANRTSGVTA
eukprot:jgi/Chlat1/5441/Chrsp36S09003